jgi:small-conductance mechanosensitive channel
VQKEKTPETFAEDAGMAEERGYVRRTLRSTLILTGFVVFVLASYTQWWAIVPFLMGVLVASLLLWSLDRFIRAVFTPERVRENKEKKGRGTTGAVILFALIKYPLVAIVLWWVARHWDINRVAAFVGGFTLLFLVIAMRAVSKMLFVTPQSTKHRS